MALDAHNDGLMSVDGFPVNGADSVGVMLLNVGPDGRVHSAPPALQGAVDVMGPGVAGLLPQVVELERDLVLGVQDPAVPKVTMLCD